MKTQIFKSLISTLLLLSVFQLNSCAPFDEDMNKTIESGFNEKKVTLSNGVVINYAEGPANGERALLLIHGQTAAWQDYKKVLPELSKNWHVFAVDCHGHGKSSHDSTRYYVDTIGDDLISFIHEVIQKETVVSGQSSGALITAYIAGNEDRYVVGSLLEDPPVFSTEKELFPQTFIYYDLYLNIHNYLHSEQTECWEIYYLRNCYWGKLYMPDKTEQMANEAKRYHEKNPDKPIKIWFLPKSINDRISGMFTYIKDYDLVFGDHYYLSTWQNNISHEKLMSDIKVPTIFMHAKDAFTTDPITKDSILMAASSDEHARKAVGLIQNCELVELESEHDIHVDHPSEFINEINKLLNK